MLKWEQFRQEGDIMYTVVVVDDERTIAEGVAALFPWDQVGFRAVPFTEPKAALAYIRENPVEVLLSDIEMPGMNGIELCRAVAELHLTVVFLSSHQNYEYLRSAIQCRVEDYILKPIQSKDVIECFGKIREKLDKRMQKEKEQPQSYYDAIKKQVIAYLETHYQDARLESAAARVGLSAAYLSSLLRDKFGSGFSEELNLIRMRKASELLRDVTQKTYDVAYYVGYDNPKSFSRAFKNHYGITPREYRMNYTGKEEGLE